MNSPTSIAELDLTPKAGKKYWNCDREWREEFIYFLMVDRFHNDRNHTPVNMATRSNGGSSVESKLLEIYQDSPANTSASL